MAPDPGHSRVCTVDFQQRPGEQGPGRFQPIARARAVIVKRRKILGKCIDGLLPLTFVTRIRLFQRRFGGWRALGNTGHTAKRHDRARSTVRP